MQTQAGKIGDDTHLNLGKLSGALERGDAGFHVGLGVGLSRFLSDQGSKWFHVAMRICDEIDRSYILPFVGGLRALHRNLGSSGNRE